MRLFLSVVALMTFLCPSAFGQKFAPNVVSAKPLAPTEQRKMFVLPAGFEIQLVAADPDIQKPMNLAFDDRGRLWVTDTVEYPWPVKPGERGRDTVKILEDIGPDGRAQKITTFADGLNIPIGLLPLNGSENALVYSIPNISRVGSRTREVLYSTYGYNDTHGMTSGFTVGFDGWIYACHGFANNSSIKGKTGGEIKMHSGNTYRFRADGTGLEQHTWGQVNPFGIAFDPLGNLFSADCHSQPIYQLLRGGYYPSFGKAHDGLGFAPAMITGFKGSTAICGIACYAADQYPAMYQGSFYIGDVMTNQVVRFEISYDGTTPKAKPVPFLDSNDQWFRPVDVKLGPDGALYIADFYNCIIGHYEVPLTHPARDRTKGRIWRIVYTGKDVKATPSRTDFATATTEELLTDLSHPNLTVRMLATNQLVSRKAAEAVTKALPREADSDDEGRARVQLLWAAQRLGRLTTAGLTNSRADKSLAVRVHVQRILSERAEWTDSEREMAHEGLRDTAPLVRRAAADAVGRHAHPTSIKPLLMLRKAVSASDTHLMHVVRMALRDQLKNTDAWKHISEDARLIADVVLGVATPESAAWLVKHLSTEKYDTANLERFVHYIARHGDDTTRQTLGDYVAASNPTSVLHQATLARAVARGTQERGGTLDGRFKKWTDDIVDKLLRSKESAEIRFGIELIGQSRLTSHGPRLAHLATAKSTDNETRLATIRALVALDDAADPIAAVLRDASLPLPTREEAATLLARLNQPQTREQLVSTLTLADGRLQTTVAARLSQSREGAEALLDAVAKGKASARLLQERAVTAQIETRGLPNWPDRLKKLTAGLPPADAKINAMMATRRAGYLASAVDASAGAAVFEKHCAACHQVAGKGAKIGPQLDGIGLRGLERLLEDTLDPNRNVDQAFRTTNLKTKRGTLLQGLLLRQEGAVLVLADAQGKEVRVKENEVEERSVSNLSPMPANFAEAIPEADFYRLIAYLLSQRPDKR